MFQLKNLKIGYGATMTSGDNDNKKYGIKQRKKKKKQKPVNLNQNIIKNIKKNHKMIAVKLDFYGR